MSGLKDYFTNLGARVLDSAVDIQSALVGYCKSSGGTPYTVLCICDNAVVLQMRGIPYYSVVFGYSGAYYAGLVDFKSGKCRAWGTDKAFKYFDIDVVSYMRYIKECEEEGRKVCPKLENLRRC